MVDSAGEVVDGDELLFIIASEEHRSKRLSGGVVGTQMSNFGLEEALGKKKIPFVRVGVGDRYVLSELDKRKWVLGGESSGHLISLNLTTTGDGVIAALQVLAAMLESDRSLGDLKGLMKKYPQDMINVACRQKVDLENQAIIAKAVARIEKKLGGCGRVLLRPSGTEPVVRVMVEGEDAALVASLTQDLAGVVTTELG
jgi:phosphoglucosamine mutase